VASRWSVSCGAARRDRRQRQHRDGRGAVELLPDVVTPAALSAAVERAGYRLAEAVEIADPVERERVMREREYRTLLHKFWLAAGVGIIAMILMMPLMMEPTAMQQADLLDRLMMPLAHWMMDVAPWLFRFSPDALRWTLLVLTTPVIFWSGRHFFKGAWSGLLHATADMNTLIAVGTGSAYLFSVAVTLAPGMF
jgi:P-type Cu+ transporter